MAQMLQSANIERSVQQTPTFRALKTLEPDLMAELTGLGWVQPMLHALWLHSPETHDHSLRVAFIASRLGLICSSPLNRSELFQAGVLHDIGKLAIPAAILHTTQRAAWQQQLFDAHPRVSAEMIKSLASSMAKIIVSHHEYQDRSYPRTTRRDDLADQLLESKRLTLALADQTDALLSRRVYKEPWNVNRTQTHLRERFDPSLVQQAISLHGIVYTA